MPFGPALPSITLWQRLEGRPRTDRVGTSLAAEVRDPAWFLARQWQVGELSGQDAGSPAFVTVNTAAGSIGSVTVGTGPSAVTKAFDPGAPLEAQSLREPFSPDDLSLQVEVGQLFEELVDGSFGAGTEPAERIKGQFRALFPVGAPAAVSVFDPLDVATGRFLMLCAGRATNGSAIHLLAGTVPAGIGQDPTEIAQIGAVLGQLNLWVDSVWGGIGSSDPEGWQPARLEYAVSVEAAAPGGKVALAVEPDSAGETPWSSFDITGTPGGQGELSLAAMASFPTHVRFPGMPAFRFWDFESGEVALPDVRPEPRDVTKLLALDFMMVHGQDWFLLTLPQQVGTLARVEELIVTDVFGRRVAVSRADSGNTAPGLTRWTAFSQTKQPIAPQPAGLGDFFLTAPTFGAALQGSRVLEQVRFARDEMANMAWAIERQTPNPIGQARNGRERDAAVEAVAPAAPPPSLDTTSPLRYLVETRVPIEYVPLVAVPLDPNNPSNPAIILEKAANVRPLPPPTGGAGAVPAASKIMNPDAISGPYQVFEEEIARLGTTVERVVFRARWIDGSTHLWIQRRKVTGSGETQSGLRFDAAIPAG